MLKPTSHRPVQTWMTANMTTDMTTNMTIKHLVLVIGARGGIAQALCKQLLTNPQSQVVAISRGPQPANLFHGRLQWLSCDHQPEEIKAIIEQVKQRQLPIARVFICTGVLHDGNIQPEKKIEQFNEVQFNQLMQVNVVIPTLWVQQLVDVCNSKTPCIISCFSARVGSISDNRLGGWYSYRMTKAALNMMLKTAAVEYGRRAKNVKLIAFHPGTTDTNLSKPFQANVPKGKLFTPQFVAEQLLSIVDNMAKAVPFDCKTTFIDWQGKPIRW